MPGESPARNARLDLMRPEGRQASFLKRIVPALAFAATFLSPDPVCAADFADQEYVIDVWETEQGLPENSATAMVQTPDGYLWFGTFNGLVRFDGVKFTVFDPSNTPQIPSGGIVNLHLQETGRLWISTLNGTACLDGGTWTAYGPEKGWSADYARTFAGGPGGVLYATSFNGKVLRWAGD